MQKADPVSVKEPFKELEMLELRNNRQRGQYGEERIPFFPTVTEITLLKSLHSLDLGCLMGMQNFETGLHLSSV